MIRRARCRLAYVMWADIAVLVIVWPGEWSGARQAIVGRVIVRMEAAERGFSGGE